MAAPARYSRIENRVGAPSRAYHTTGMELRGIDPWMTTMPDPYDIVWPISVGFAISIALWMALS